MTKPQPKKQTMTQKKTKRSLQEIKELIGEQEDILRPLISTVLQEVLEAEMSEAVGAEKSERAEGRLGYRSGYYVRSLITRVGKLELRVPQDRQGRFSSELFERYQRSEKALVGALAEMYVQGVSTRKIKAITEELCGHAFSASAISAINKRLDEELQSFMHRPLEEEFPYLILDARYEKVREEGVIRSRAVLVALGVDWEGRRQVLAVELANRERRAADKAAIKPPWATSITGRSGPSGSPHSGSPDTSSVTTGRPRLATSIRLSPPCGAHVASSRHASLAPGASASIWAWVKPCQSPRWVSRSRGSTRTPSPVRSPSLIAVS